MQGRFTAIGHRNTEPTVTVEPLPLNSKLAATFKPESRVDLDVSNGHVGVFLVGLICITWEQFIGQWIPAGLVSRE